MRGGSLGNGEGRGGGRNRKRLNRPDPTLVKTGITDVPAAILYTNNSHHIPDVQTKENASITSIRRRDVSAIILPLCNPSCSSALPPQPSFAMMLVPSSSPPYSQPHFSRSAASSARLLLDILPESFDRRLAARSRCHRGGAHAA